MYDGFGYRRIELPCDGTEVCKTTMSQHPAGGTILMTEQATGGIYVPPGCKTFGGNNGIGIEWRGR